MSAPTVSVLVPTLNEATTIAECIRALADQDLGTATMEIIVADGGSSDATVEVARAELAAMPSVRSEVLHNAPGTRPSNLNAALRRAQAPHVCRVDARSRVPKHYVRQCVEVLTERPDVAVVGGRQRAIGVAGDPVSSGIARALNNRWAMGFSRYRFARMSQPSDTVYLGAFRTEQLRASGGWREDLLVNEDFDLCRRMAKVGLVWFDHELAVDYEPRRGLAALGSQYVSFGQWKVRYWRSTGDSPRPRQLALMGVPIVAGAVVLVGLRRYPLRTVALGTVGALTVEGAGTDGPPAGIAARLIGVAGMAMIGGGWLAGIATEALSRSMEAGS